MACHVTFSSQEILVPEQPNIAEGYSEPVNREEFLKLKAKRILDSTCCTAGVLLVSSDCIAFCPDVTQSAVFDHDEDTHSIMHMENIVRVALYKQLHNFNVAYDDDDEDGDDSDKNAQHSHGEIYRGESNDKVTPTQIPMPYVDTMLPHCLCIKVLSSEAYRTKEFVNCNSVNLPDGEVGDKNERNFWFSIPPSKVDILYKFFVQWSPEKYANFETNEIFSDVHAPNVVGSFNILKHNKVLWSPSDYQKEILHEEAEVLHLHNQTVNNLTLIIENLRIKIGRPIEQPGAFWHDISKYQNERLPQLEKTKTQLEYYCKIMNAKTILSTDPQVAIDKRDLMKKRKNEKYNKLTHGVLKAEDVAGFRGKKSIDNILQFIEGGSKHNPKKEKNKSGKKMDTKKCSSSNFTDNNVVKSIKKTDSGNEFSGCGFESYKGEISKKEFSVDGIESYKGEISKKLPLLCAPNNDFYDSENSEHEEYLTDFIPVSRNRLPKFKSDSVNEEKPVNRSKSNFEQPAASRMSKNKKQKSKKMEKSSINPYSWPFILLKPENYKVDESESGKFATSENVNVGNSSNFSCTETLSHKKQKNEKSNEPLSHGLVSTAAKNKAPIELTPLSDHCHVLSLRYCDDICEYEKIARKLQMMCNDAKTNIVFKED